MVAVVYNLLRNKAENNGNTTPTHVFNDNDSTLVGYVYSSGLKNNDAQYQLTYLNYAQSTILPTSIKTEIDGVFLNPTTSINNDLISLYWSKCVEVVGSIPANLNKTALSENYYRANLVIKTIQQSDKCTVDFDNSTDSGSITGSYAGTIARNNRPSPDIAYDYKLILTTPHTDDSNAAGTSQLITEIIIVPMTNDIFNKFKNNLGKPVTVSGGWMTGFAETSFFLVNSL